MKGLVPLIPVDGTKKIESSGLPMAYDEENLYISRKFLIHIVDRIGGGDSFGAGLIYGLNHYESCQQALEFAVAASCLKQTIEGDFNMVKVSEVESLMNGNVFGRIKR